MIMKTGTITAKLRAAVPVCLEVNCKEAEQYKSIALLKIFLKIHPAKYLQIVKKSLLFMGLLFY